MEGLKQPELGNTIATLRQEKQMTQEELVERCNLSVRTLQRIEAGDVTPRDFTIKAILEVLEFDMDQITTNLENEKRSQQIQLAWIAGIVYFVLGLFETIAELYRYEGELPFYFPAIYTTIKVLAAASFVYFMLGFAAVGRYYKSGLLTVSAYLMLGSMIVMELYDAISIFSDLTTEEFFIIKGGQGVAFGGIDIVLGIALLRLGRKTGNAATLAGMCEIALGICFVSFVLAPIGLALMIPATILEIIVLYKCQEMLSSDD